jgi:hypothetical protein
MALMLMYLVQPGFTDVATVVVDGTSETGGGGVGVIFGADVDPGAAVGNGVVYGGGAWVGPIDVRVDVGSGVSEVQPASSSADSVISAISCRDLIPFFPLF